MRPTQTTSGQFLRSRYVATRYHGCQCCEEGSNLIDNGFGQIAMQRLRNWQPQASANAFFLQVRDETGLGGGQHDDLCIEMQECIDTKEQADRSVK